MGYPQAKAYLDKVYLEQVRRGKWVKKNYNLRRIRDWAQFFEHPQQQYPIIHIAGTNGKGSVCAMLASIYRQAGYRTGLFTSPHLVCLEERIQINGERLPQEALVDYVQELKTSAARIVAELGGAPSFFEHMTMMAFLHFARMGVDIAIVEAGLGGTLDATNVVDPVLTIITSIGLDHEAIIGPGIENIARAKAGIIKKNTPVVIGRLPTAATAVVHQAATARQAKLHRVEDRFGHDSRSYPTCALVGDHQRINAGVATCAVEILASHFPVSAAAIARGLATVSWPGRWQEVPLADRQPLILDGAHNLDSALALEQNILRLLAQQPRIKLSVVVGVTDTDRAAFIVPIVARHAQRLYLVELSQPRTCSLSELQRCIPASYSGEVVAVATGASALFGYPQRWLATGDDNAILATGSLFLIGEILGLIHVSNAETSCKKVHN